ncbi:hypothetical protein ISCGN_018440 [Ixodes scapularis]|uniref:Secreted protein n=1 Tax=Ixodes scapularis TaxID=6945 RepID=B7PEV3_IXOSC|nr:hypothetical protein IscW_ISCW017827 [Ixodes scapularis]|eukprot:XP_002433725.1 hypothetical protein IscW_ISCW017827 [Ixodes scapularis]
MGHVPTRPALLLLCLVLGCRPHPLPLLHRLVQNLFEPERLNYWFTLWEKVIHLGRFHVHNVPRILLMPFTHMQHFHGRMPQLRSVAERLATDQQARGVVAKEAAADRPEPAKH